MSYFPEDIPFMSKEELRENGIRIPKDATDTNVGDTISRQAAIDGKIIIQRTNGVEIYYDEAVPVGYLKRLPTVQPEPHEGHWIRRDCGLDVECKCSKCGYRDFVEPRDEYWFNRNFCPNCGAKMKGERQK